MHSTHQNAKESSPLAHKSYLMQVTDTPGLLNRKEEDRNKMEMLTLACLTYLPSAIVFVMDLTGTAFMATSSGQLRTALRRETNSV